MPMSGSHGAGGDKQERERTTWLTEDEDVWGGDVGGSGGTDTDREGRGTRMAAWIAGQGSSADLVGIVSRAKILSIVVNSTGRENGVSVFSTGVRWAVDHGARVINISQVADGAGFPDNCPREVQDAVSYALRAGAVVVAASGDAGDTTNPAYHPAACRGVLAVGAVDADKHVWPQTGRQDYVDVAAPGVHMYGINAAGQGGYGDGTSNSAAVTSAAIALVWSKYPRLSNRQVVARILATLTDDADQPGPDNATGMGIVRPYYAITRDIPVNAPNPVFDELSSAASAGPAQSPARPTGPDRQLRRSLVAVAVAVALPDRCRGQPRLEHRADHRRHRRSRHRDPARHPCRGQARTPDQRAARLAAPSATHRGRMGRAPPR